MPFDIRILFNNYRANNPPRKCADCDRSAEISHKRCPECAWNAHQREQALRKGTTAMKRKLLKARGSICQRCGASTAVEMHHIIPVSEGGTTIEENLILLCQPCHRLQDRERNS